MPDLRDSGPWGPCVAAHAPPSQPAPWLLKMRRRAREGKGRGREGEVGSRVPPTLIFFSLFFLGGKGRENHPKKQGFFLSSEPRKKSLEKTLKNQGNPRKGKKTQGREIHPKKLPTPMNPIENSLRKQFAQTLSACLLFNLQQKRRTICTTSSENCLRKLFLLGWVGILSLLRTPKIPGKEGGKRSKPKEALAREKKKTRNSQKKKTRKGRTGSYPREECRKGPIHEEGGFI